LNLKVLLIGYGSSDPTTAAWEATLTNEGVPYTLATASGTTGSETVTLPPLTASGNSNQGLFNGVVLADAPAAFASGQLTTLFAYESAFSVRQVDGYAYPSPTLGLTEVTGGALDGTTATLTAAGLTTFPSLKGPVPFDTGTYGYGATVATGLPAGASETPLLDNASGNVLMGIYQHPVSAADPQSGVAELTIGFNYNANQLQWLILGPDLIDWVTGGEHLGLYRNYIGQDVDDLFIADNEWSSTHQCTPGATDPSDFTCPTGVANNPAATPPDVQMSTADVAYVVNWEKQNNFTLNLAFNAAGACTAPSAADESTANCTGSTTINDATYTDPGQDTSDLTVPNDSAFVDALLANQGSFNWITHTWSHQFLGCITWQPMAINSAPVAGSGGSLGAGTYYYEVTAATAYGESEPSLAALATVAADGAVTLSWPDATNGGGPLLFNLESEFSGGSGFWGYYVYRSTSSSGPFGLVGQVAEDPTGATTSYSFIDTGASSPGGPPSSSATFPTATNPGIECAPGGWEPASSTSPDSSIDQEIGLDVAFAQANGLTNFSPSAVVTGEHSGLENPNMPTAFADMGITTFAADASRQVNPYTITGTSGTTSVTAHSSPRYPSNIYYNASNWVDELNEYNTLYVAEGDSIGTGSETGRCANTSSTTCLTTPATETSLLASESRIELGHVLNDNPRVTYAHQSNLIGPDYTLLTLLSDILGQYNTWYSSATPYVQTTDATSSQILSEQATWAAANTAGTVSASNSGGIVTITNNGTSSIAVPVTAPVGSTSGGAAFGTPYGDTLSAWETLAAGASLTISGTITQGSPTSGTTTTGKAFTSQLTVSGSHGTVTYTQSSGAPSLTVSSSGAVSAPATLTANTYTASGSDSDTSGDTGTWSFSLTATTSTTITQGTPTTGTTTTGKAFTSQLTVSGSHGTVTYIQSTGTPNLTVSSSGAVSAPATLAVGSYTASGSDSDTSGDTGTWTFSLTVTSTTRTTITQGTPTTGTTTTGKAFTSQLTVSGSQGTVTYTQSSGAPSLTVSSSGAVSAPATLTARNYIATGTDKDTSGDTGTWSFSLTVT
jgi:hypothetical protein